MFVQQDINIIIYIEFEGNKYFNGDYVEVLYENGDIRKGKIEIGRDYIVVHPTPRIGYEHHLYCPINSKIKEINMCE